MDNLVLSFIYGAGVSWLIWLSILILFCILGLWNVRLL